MSIVRNAIGWSVLAVMACCLAASSATTWAADELIPLDIRHVKVSGEIGRRIDITINNNLLALNADKDSLPPFQDKKARDGYVGLGKLIDAAVRLGAYSGDTKVLALKAHLATGDYDLVLTEFPDPAGKAAYFRLRNLDSSVDDELLYTAP